MDIECQLATDRRQPGVAVADVAVGLEEAGEKRGSHRVGEELWTIAGTRSSLALPFRRSLASRNRMICVDANRTETDASGRSSCRSTQKCAAPPKMDRVSASYRGRSSGSSSPTCTATKAVPGSSLIYPSP